MIGRIINYYYSWYLMKYVGSFWTKINYSWNIGLTSQTGDWAGSWSQPDQLRKVLLHVYVLIFFFNIELLNHNRIVYFLLMLTDFIGLDSDLESDNELYVPSSLVKLADHLSRDPDEHFNNVSTNTDVLKCSRQLWGGKKKHY